MSKITVNISNYLKLVLETQSHCSVAPPSCYRIARLQQGMENYWIARAIPLKGLRGGDTLSCIGRGSQTQETTFWSFH